MNQLLPIEINSVVRQEIRRIQALASKLAEPPELLFKRVQWRIENALRMVDAGEFLPVAFSVLQQHWQQVQFQPVRAE